MTHELPVSLTSVINFTLMSTTPVSDAFPVLECFTRFNDTAEKFLTRVNDTVEAKLTSVNDTDNVSETATARF